MLKKIGLIFLSITFLNACSSSEETIPDTIDNFDREVMLTHIADNIIIPSYENFSIKMATLKSSVDIFNTNTNQENLISLRTSWIYAYKAWQQIELFDIGKAEDLQYKFYMNVYPVTVADIETNIANGTYDLKSVNYQDAQGFPALDYLLYGVADTDTAILEKYTTHTNANGYKKYLEDVVNFMSDLTTQILEDWNTYRNDFINSTANTATSAVNKLVNDYIFYYEKGLRANKFGIPAGVFSATTLPEKVEVFYNKEISKELALEALNTVINFFEGTYTGNSNANRSSFKAYLIALDREDLATKISNQFNAAKTQISSLNTNFYEQVTTDNSKMTLSYDELQKVVVLLKVDMLQAFNINVDYVDADGD